MQHTAMNLTLDNQGVHLVAAVVDGYVVDQLDVARFGVNFGHGNVGAIREGEVGRIERCLRYQIRLEAVGQIVSRERGKGDIAQRSRLGRRSLHVEGAVLELEIILARFELVGGDAARLVENSLGGHEHRGAAHRQGP